MRRLTGAILMMVAGVMLGYDGVIEHNYFRAAMGLLALIAGGLALPYKKGT